MNRPTGKGLLKLMQVRKFTVPTRTTVRRAHDRCKGTRVVFSKRPAKEEA